MRITNQMMINSLNEVTQYLKKNIPDAQQWLSTTQGALTQGESVINKLYEYCNQGSSDSYASEQRNTIAESLKALKKTFYDEGYDTHLSVRCTGS